MLHGELRDLCSIGEERSGRQDHDASGALSGNRREGAVELGAVPSLKHLKLHTQRSRRGLRSFQIGGDTRLAGALRTAIRATPGVVSWRSWNRFPAISGVGTATPVMFPPARPSPA